MKNLLTPYVLLLVILLASNVIAQDSSLIAYWTFDDSTAYDSSGYQNHGTLHGVISAENRFGESNRGFYFDGIDDYISIDSYYNMSPSTAVSVAAWIKTADTLENRVVIYDRLETQDGFGLVLNESGYPRLSINGGTASCTAQDEVDDQQWHLIVATYSSFNNKLMIYVDAVLSDTTLYSDSIDYSPEPRNQIGRTLAGEDHFHGVIDEIRIYDRELQENEIIQLYGNYTSLDDDFKSGLITNYVLLQNYPNPFNPKTVISYQLPVSSKVTLKIYDVLGNEMATLVNEELPAGEYEVEFSTRSHSGLSGISDISSGIYFYQLLVSALQNKDGKESSFIQTKKMILIK